MILTALLPGRARLWNGHDLQLRGSGERHQPEGLNRKHTFDSVKASSTHLQLEYIDVLQRHRIRLYYAD